MGRAGPGALRKEDRDALKPLRAPPWKKKNLTRVERVIAFLEFLPITKGKLVGKKMRLLPGQRRFIEDVYGRTAEHPVRIAIYSEPRGNGKTGLIAALELCHLLGPESEMRGECYSAGIDRQQAALIFNEMVAMIGEVDDFRARTNITRWHKSIEVVSGDGVGSKYEALSADARRAHGLAPSFWAYDELAQAKDRVLLDNLQTAMGKRQRTLGMVISTQAANNDHPLSELIDDSISGADPSIVCHVLSAPDTADPFAPATLRACNPALGIFLDEADLIAEADRARRMPSFESAFRNLRLNQRVALYSRDQLCTPAVWALGNDPINREIFYDGRPVYAGLDLSQARDLSALVFAAEDDARLVHLMPRAWIPQDDLIERMTYDRAPYDAWIRQGDLIGIPGKVIDYDFVTQMLATEAHGMNIARIFYDPWRIKDLERSLAHAGVSMPLEACGQGMKSMSPAIESFEVIAKPGRWRHGNHPLMRWCFANTMVERDAAGNRKPDKSKPYGRIDVAVAALMAIAAMKNADAPFEVATLIA